MNLVILKGRLTKDPDIRYTQSGKAVAAFTIATDKRMAQNSQGPTADFHNCLSDNIQLKMDLIMIFIFMRESTLDD